MEKGKIRVSLCNLGCKVNGYETERMASEFLKAGYEVVPFQEAADVCVINTCTVTNIADRKSRKMLRHAAKMNPGAVIVAAGCYADACFTEPDEKLADLWVVNKEKKNIVPLVGKFLAQRGEEPSCTAVGGTEHASPEGHTRAYLKIQDGCNQFCSYCIIPYVRGRVESRRPEEVLAEAERLAAQGYREIVLTGIHISSYGIDFKKKKENTAQKVEAAVSQGAKTAAAAEGGRTAGSFDLIDLVCLLHGTEGIDRIRLGSMEPGIITEENIRILAGLKKVCPHFHLSLQSGCDATLRRMNRHYTTGEYLEKCKIIRRYYPNAAITTDVIVGFPGETEEEFETTRAFVREAGFARMHIFRYSVRQGTRAAAMDCQIPEPVKEARSAILREENRALENRYRDAFLGKTEEVLFEEEITAGGEMIQVGHTIHYLKVGVRSARDLKNRILAVRLVGDDPQEGPEKEGQRNPNNRPGGSPDPETVMGILV